MGNKFFIFGFYLTLITIFCFVFFVNVLGDIRKEAKKESDKIGTRVILENDTLMIIDCSHLMGTYTLSNGKEISHVLLNKLTVVE